MGRVNLRRRRGRGLTRLVQSAEEHTRHVHEQGLVRDVFVWGFQRNVNPWKGRREKSLRRGGLTTKYKKMVRLPWIIKCNKCCHNQFSRMSQREGTAPVL